MKLLACIALIFLSACGGNEQKTVSSQDTAKAIQAPEPVTEIPKTDSVVKPDPAPVPKVYSNKRFKEVTVISLGDNKYRIIGKAQIFEASFSWVIEDGHEELQEGHAMTHAGAPEWGSFSFVVEAKKKRPNSTLHLVLYESSAKDGSRQYELPVLLY